MTIIKDFFADKLHVMVFDTREAMGRKAGEQAAARIRELLAEKEEINIIFAAAPSQNETLETLVSAEGIDWARVNAFHMDEYVGLDKDHDQSYAYFMRDNLFNHINLDLSNTNVPDGMDPDGDSACARYDQIIRDLGGIDLQLLGLGVNGHIGFNEPADAFSLGTHQVELTDSTRQANRRFFSSLEEVPTHARTMGVRDIMQARKVLMVANGAAKAQAIRDAFFGPVTPHVPASILQLHGDFTLVADEEALSLI